MALTALTSSKMWEMLFMYPWTSGGNSDVSEEPLSFHVTLDVRTFSKDEWKSFPCLNKSETNHHIWVSSVCFASGQAVIKFTTCFKVVYTGGFQVLSKTYSDCTLWSLPLQAWRSSSSSISPGKRSAPGKVSAVGFVSHSVPKISPGLIKSGSEVLTRGLLSLKSLQSLRRDVRFLVPLPRILWMSES